MKKRRQKKGPDFARMYRFLAERKRRIDEATYAQREAAAARRFCSEYMCYPIAGPARETCDACVAQPTEEKVQRLFDHLMQVRIRPMGPDRAEFALFIALPAEILKEEKSELLFRRYVAPQLDRILVAWRNKRKHKSLIVEKPVKGDKILWEDA